MSTGTDIAAYGLIGIAFVLCVVGIAMLIGVLFLWICVEVFVVGVWSYWNSLVIGLFVLCMWALFKSEKD